MPWGEWVSAQRSQGLGEWDVRSEWYGLYVCGREVQREVWLCLELFGNGKLVITHYAANHGWRAQNEKEEPPRTPMQRQSQNMSQIFSQDSVPAAAPVKESLGSTFSLRRSARWWIFDSTDAADSTRLSPEELAKLSKDTGGVTMRQWDWQVIALNDLQWIYLCNLCNLCNHAVICRPISSNPWLRSREFTTRWSGGAKGLPRSPSCCPASACGQEAADQGGDSFMGALFHHPCLLWPKMLCPCSPGWKKGRTRGTAKGWWGDVERNVAHEIVLVMDDIYIYIIYIYIL